MPKFQIKAIIAKILKSNKSRVRIEKLLLSSTKDMVDQVILDAGCGDMQYKKYAVNNSYLGVDFGRVDKYYPHGSFIEADLSNIPINSNSVDLIWCIQVLEHIPNPAAVLEELYRVAKNKTTLVMTVPFIYQEHEIPYDFFRYTRYGVQHLLENSQWEAISIEPLENCTDILYQLLKISLKVKPASNTPKIKLYAYILLTGFLKFVSIIIRLIDLDIKLDPNSTVVKNWKVIAIKNEKLK